MKDVFDAADERGLKIVFEAEDVRLHDVESPDGRSSPTGRTAQLERIECDFVAGCDGSHGVSHSAIPHGER